MESRILGAFVRFCLRVGQGIILQPAWLIQSILLANTMLSKNSRGYNEEQIPAKKRFRHNLANAYLAGQLTAGRTESLLSDAQAAGASGVDNLSNLGTKKANRSLKKEGS